MQNFRAFRVHSEDKKISTKIDQIGIEDLSEGEVVVKVEYSGVNYKDALAGTGTGRIMRRFPMVAGIDLAGTVESSTDPEYAPGTQ